MARNLIIRLLGPLIPALLLTCASGAQAQTENPVIHVDTNLRSIAVRVTDKQGHDIQHLSAVDFTILEDGHPQKISFFAAENQPISLSILLDASGSMHSGGKLERAQSLLAQLIRNSRPEDEISLAEFTDHVGPSQQLTGQQRLHPPVSDIASARSGTALYDALASAICHLRPAKNMKQAVVVITDGADQHSRIALEQLIELVQSSRAQVFMIGFYSFQEYQIYNQREKTVTLVSGREIDNPLIVFDRLARDSGAESFFPANDNDLQRALQAVASTLDAQYTLAYYPQGAPRGFRRIKVNVNRPGLEVRARRGVGAVPDAAGSVHFLPGTCDVSPEFHRYPYESRLTESGGLRIYHEDFSDPNSGWPDRIGSQYKTRGGYELSYDVKNLRESLEAGNKVMVGEGAFAAYGPFWDDFHASAVVDADWAKMKALPDFHLPAAGLAFHVNESGYYAFLLGTRKGAKDLSWRLVKKNYSSARELDIIPWTEISVLPRATPGTKLSVECIGGQIKLFVDDQEVGNIRDSTFADGYVGLVLSLTGRATFHDLLVEGPK